MQKGVPIKPSDIPASKAAYIPPFVFDCFNECITKHYVNGRSHFTLQEVQRLVEKACAAAHVAYETHFMDIESVYEQNGWKVEYDCPSYAESYPSKFTFIEKE